MKHGPSILLVVLTASAFGFGRAGASGGSSAGAASEHRGEHLVRTAQMSEQEWLLEQRREKQRLLEQQRHPRAPDRDEQKCGGCGVHVPAGMSAREWDTLQELRRQAAREKLDGKRAEVLRRLEQKLRQAQQERKLDPEKAEQLRRQRLLDERREEQLRRQRLDERRQEQRGPESAEQEPTRGKP